MAAIRNSGVASGESPTAFTSMGAAAIAMPLADACTMPAPRRIRLASTEMRSARSLSCFSEAPTSMSA